MPLNHMLKKYYTQSEEQDDLISIGTIGLIKGISTFKPEKGARLATYAARCVENEILMYFRSRKKLQGEVSLSDSIETDQDGNDLMLMDVVGVDDTMLSDLQDREDSVLVRRLVRECLTDREREILTLVARGLNNEQIGERLFISPATVKTHLARIMGKLDAHDRAQLVVRAYESGLVKPGVA